MRQLVARTTAGLSRGSMPAGPVADGNARPPLELWTAVVVFLTVLIAAIWPRYFFVSAGPIDVSPYTILTVSASLYSVVVLVLSEATRDRWLRCVARSAPLLAVFLLVLVFHLVSDLAGDLPKVAGQASLRSVVYIYSYVFVGSVLLIHVLPRNAAAQALVVSAIIIVALAVVERAAGRSLASILHINEIAAGDKLVLNLAALSKSRDGALRAQSVFEHPILLGQLSAALVPLCYQQARQGAHWIRRPAIVALALLPVGMMLSGTRSSLFVLLASLGAWFMMGGLAGYKLNARQLLSVAISIIIAAVVWISFGHALEQSITGRTTAEMNSSAARTEQLQRGISALQASPWLGFGESRSAVRGGLMNGSGQWQIDNGYLSVALDFGLIGLALWALFVTLIVVFGMRAAASRGLGKDSAMLSAYLALFVGLLLGRSVQSILDLETFSMIAVGLILATAYTPDERTGRPDGRFIYARQRPALNRK